MFQNRILENHHVRWRRQRSTWSFLTVRIVYYLKATLAHVLAVSCVMVRFESVPINCAHLFIFSIRHHYHNRTSQITIYVRTSATRSKYRGRGRSVRNVLISANTSEWCRLCMSQDTVKYVYIVMWCLFRHFDDWTNVGPKSSDNSYCLKRSWSSFSISERTKRTVSRSHHTDLGRHRHVQRMKDPTDGYPLYSHCVRCISYKTRNC